MGLTAFPNGVSSFGMPVMGAGEETVTTGNVFFVDSGSPNADDGHGNQMTAPDRPAATIDAAMAKTTANQGDIIFVMPGHSEDVSASITMDVAGVWVRGLGWGANRPTITLTTSTTIAMSAASTRLSNIIIDLLASGTDITVTNAITVTAADVIVENIETRSHATSQFTNHINVNASGTRCIIRNCFLKSLITASSSSGLQLDGCDGIQILNNVIMGHYGAAGCIDNLTGSDEAKQAVIANNWVHNDSSTGGDLAVVMDPAATGLFVNNRISGALDFAANYDLGNLRAMQNYLVDAPDFFDLIIPTTTAG